MTEQDTREEVTIEQAVEILLAEVESLQTRLDQIENTFTKATSTVSPDRPLSVTFGRRPKRLYYRTDPFHGLFGYYFVLGMLLLVSLGVVLSLTNSDSLASVGWWCATILSVFQLFFLMLGVFQRDRRTWMNATIGFGISLLIIVGMLRWVPFSS
ncbi:membrane hypothetical protein [Gammaproteobacteria bacterium]